jgi:hypothetical protein
MVQREAIVGGQRLTAVHDVCRVVQTGCFDRAFTRQVRVTRVAAQADPPGEQQQY